MTHLTDIQIAQATPIRPIAEIAAKIGLGVDDIIPYGRTKAKIPLSAIDTARPKGKLVMVTAINPTPAGEGKTTCSIGLADGLRKIGKNAVAALREPSLGPVFGVKGGAAGGGYAQVIPMEDINLHFTGDFHAIGAANNLLAAMLDNHIFQGNELGIDVRKITLRRVVDMNDRQLRGIVSGLGSRVNGMPREDGFDITVASEVMACLCLADSITDLKARLGRIIVGYTRDDKPVTASDLKAAGAMTALLKEAILPNLVQTLEGTPVLIHGGPFANIAHGCNSIIATKMAMCCADYTVTESGFGADLGAEKFLDIKCRTSGLTPHAVVIVATVRALKHHGNGSLEAGLPNLVRHIDNIKNTFKLPVAVAIMRPDGNTPEENALLKQTCDEMGVGMAIHSVWANGGEGGRALAEQVVALCEDSTNSDTFTLPYKNEDSVTDKLNAIVTKIYRGDGVDLTAAAKKDLAAIEAMGLAHLPICMAKTQYSFSDNAALLGAPTAFRVTVRNLKACAGAGFIVALTGDIMTMPGLPKIPAAEAIDIDENGVISGLF